MRQQAMNSTQPEKPMERPEKLRPRVRWMIRSDVPMVLDIEQACFEFPWNEENLITCLRGRNCIGMVAEHGGGVCGHFVYELYPMRVELYTFAVDPQHQRRGVGLAMVEKLKSKLSAQKRTRIACNVDEMNLNAQQFFRSQGFRAVGVLRDHWAFTDRDAYRFCFHRRPSPDERANTI
jgi:ribosomal-protein-alanine N-acetyltransferase